MKIKISKRKVFLMFEKVYAAFTLFMMVRPLHKFESLVSANIQFLIVAGLYLFILPFILKRFASFLKIIFRDMILVFLVCFVLLSTLWSIDPIITLKDCVNFIGATLFGVYLALRFNMREQMQILLGMFVLSAVVSAFVIITQPEVGTYVVPGGGGIAWTGLWDRKNKLGRYMATSALLSWLLIQTAKKNLLLWGSFALSIIVLMLTRSASPLVALAFTLGTLPVMKIMKSVNIKVFFLLMVAGVLIVTTAVLIYLVIPGANMDWFFILLGRDPDQNTLQIRIALWSEALQNALQRPLFGYGFGIQEDMAVATWHGGVWTPSQTHNGYLGILLQLGLIGLSGLLIHLAVNVLRAIKLTRIQKSTEATWILAYLIMLAIFNLTESIFLGQLTMPWTIYVTITLTMCVSFDQMKGISLRKTDYNSGNVPG